MGTGVPGRGNTIKPLTAIRAAKSGTKISIIDSLKFELIFSPNQIDNHNNKIG